jgi:uncharacterized protein (DUF1499 family)
MRASISRKLIVSAMFISLAACAAARGTRLELAMDRFAPCPDSPNCVFSDAPPGGHHIDPFAIAGSPDDWDALWSAVAEAVERLPRARVVMRTERYLHAECRSLLFRFVDDLELQLRPDRNEIAVRCFRVR